MSPRLKVYGFIGVVALAAGAAYLYKTKPAWLGNRNITRRKAREADETHTSRARGPMPLVMAARQRRLTGGVSSRRSSITRFTPAVERATVTAVT